MIAIDDLRAQWDANFTAWESAKAEYDFADGAYEAAHKEAGGDETADNDPTVVKLLTLLDRRATSENKTRFELLLTPAPDFAAVAWKLHALYGVGDFEGDEYTSAWRREYPLSIMADMARLQSNFAETWLAAWTKDGGSVTIDDGGKAQFGWLAYDLSPTYREPAADLPQQARDSSFLHAQAHYDATMRARYEVLELVPGGVGIVKDHMRLLGMRCAHRRAGGQ